MISALEAVSLMLLSLHTWTWMLLPIRATRSRMTVVFVVLVCALGVPGIRDTSTVARLTTQIVRSVLRMRSLVSVWSEVYWSSRTLGLGVAA